MSAITLDAIRDAADAKYGSYDISLGDDTNPVRLLNPLRLPKVKRDALQELQRELKAVSEDDAAEIDQVDIFQRMIRTVAETDGKAKALLDAVGEDLALLAEIVGGYSEGTQVGEASASAA